MTQTNAGPDPEWVPTPITAETLAANTGPISEVLALMIFKTGPIARVYRAAGEDIPRKIEAEQSFVLRRLLKHVTTHGAGWAIAAEAEMSEMLEVARAKGAAV